MCTLRPSLSREKGIQGRRQKVGQRQRIAPECIGGFQYIALWKMIFCWSMTLLQQPG